jgi:hypothetical protein
MRLERTWRRFWEAGDCCDVLVDHHFRQERRTSRVHDRCSWLTRPSTRTFRARFGDPAEVSEPVYTVRMSTSRANGIIIPPTIANHRMTLFMGGKLESREQAANEASYRSCPRALGPMRPRIFLAGDEIAALQPTRNSRVCLELNLCHAERRPHAGRMSCQGGRIPSYGKAD